MHAETNTNLLKTFDPHDVRVRRRKGLVKKDPTDEGSKWQRQSPTIMVSLTSVTIPRANLPVAWAAEEKVRGFFVLGADKPRPTNTIKLLTPLPKQDKNAP
jgi:hypothetical protein